MLVKEVFKALDVFPEARNLVELDIKIYVLRVLSCGCNLLASQVR